MLDDGRKNGAIHSSAAGITLTVRPVSKAFSKVAKVISREVGRAWVFVIAVLSIVVWAATGSLFKYSDTWQLVINTGTTIITFLMVFLIQNAQNRDAAAIQAKLDELIRSVDKARNPFIGIEHLTDAQIEEIRAALEREQDGSQTGKSSTAGGSVERLLRRY